jgi:hypothetical protein
MVMSEDEEIKHSKDLVPRYLLISSLLYEKSIRAELLRDPIDTSIFYLQAGKSVYSVEFQQLDLIREKLMNAVTLEATDIEEPKKKLIIKE